GADILIHEAGTLELTPRERERLAAGKVMMRLGEVEGADIYFQFPEEDRYLSTRMTRVSEQQARATALLILDELSQYPSSQWDEEFARIQHHFGYPLARLPYEQV